MSSLREVNTLNFVNRYREGNLESIKLSSSALDTRLQHQPDLFIEDIRVLNSSTQLKLLISPASAESCSLMDLYVSVGFYTAWLLPAAVVGTLVFVSGVMSMGTNTPA